MIGLDTNVVLRYLIGDDDVQSKEARFVIDDVCSPDTPGFIHSVVLAELWWVMVRKLKIPRSEAIEHMESILSNPHLTVRSTEAVLQALFWCGKSKIDFADGLIAFENRSEGVLKTLSFDKVALETTIMAELPRNATINLI